MWVNTLILICGLLLLIKGADWLVNGASALAKKHNVSDLVIGLTIVAFGTSAPELVVNVFAAAKGHHEIVFSNVIGSNIINLFLILGIAGLITPIVVQSDTVWKEIPISLGAVIILFVLANDFWFLDNSSLARYDGLLLLGFFVLFLFYAFKKLKTDKLVIEMPVKKYSGFKIWTLIIGGLTGLTVGGRFLVDNAVEIAAGLGVSEKIIGMTVVAIGTSLPELATSIIAAFKKNSDIAIGNIIGSNIFNILLVLGLSSLIKPVVYNDMFNQDLYFLAAGTVFLFIAMFTNLKRKLDRIEALLLLIAYVVYTYFLLNDVI